MKYNVKARQSGESVIYLVGFAADEDGAVALCNQLIADGYHEAWVYEELSVEREVQVYHVGR